MTPERLAEIKARCEKASDGPWTPNYSGEVDGPAYVGTVTVSGFRRYHDAAFVSHARQDVPDLLAALAALQQRVERLEGALRKAEWGAMGTHYGEFIPECPVCLNNPVQRHADDCELSAALADAGTGVTAAAGSCRCGRRLIRDGAGDPDPWCEGCAMSAKTCDCVSVQREASHAANGD